MLNSDQLNVVIKRAYHRFEQIKKKHPEVKAYMVFSSRKGQVDIEASLRQMLQEFPEMVVDDKARNEALKIITEIKKAEKNDRSSEVERLGRQLAMLTVQVRYDDNVRVEIRFKDLKYDHVWALQANEYVDRSLTPQTKASIRIVLGTLRALHC